MKKLRSLTLAIACLALAGCSGAPTVSSVVAASAPAATPESVATAGQNAPVQGLTMVPAPTSPSTPGAAPAPQETTAPVAAPAPSRAPAPEAPPATQADAHEPVAVPQQVTMADNNKTFVMSVNQTFALVLGGPEPTWAVSIDNPAVLSRVVNIMPIRGSQGVFRAHTPGTAHLQAVGTFACQQAKPISCKIASPLFQINVIVQ